MKTTITFDSCGLNADDNIFNKQFMIECDDEQMVINFMYEILEDIECPYVAIFAITQSNHIIIGHKNEDEIQCGVAKPDVGTKNSRNYVKKVLAGCQKEMEYPYYGLLEQVDDSHYVVIMN